MAHHGWVASLDPRTLTPTALQSPFGRLFGAAGHAYDSLAIALMAGPRGPIELGTAANKPGNPAGFTFFGQFVDHDVTEFRVIGPELKLIPMNPTIGARQRVLEDGLPTATNGRTSRLDLDSVYGLLGFSQADLFDSHGNFILDPSGTDIMRTAAGRLIADPRNDENKLVVQVHLLFERLHNKVHSAKPGNANDKQVNSDLFKETRREVQDAYRRIVLHDYLPLIVQRTHLDAVAAKLAASGTYFQASIQRAREAFPLVAPGEPIPADLLPMPVEFAQAVFRLGHSQLLPGYDLNAGNIGVPLFAPQADLRGNEALGAAFVVEWERFFEGGANGPQHGQPLDALLAQPVFRLPPPAIGEPPQSLAERNIRRGVDFGLPSGQECWTYLETLYGPLPPVAATTLFPPSLFTGPTARFREVLKRDPRLAVATPLWYYVLCEAGAHSGGPQLGAVGGLIVAETLMGLLNATSGFDLPSEYAKTSTISLTASPGGVQDINSMQQLLTFLGEF